MRIVEVIVSPDPELPEAVTCVGCQHEAVEDNLFMELELYELVCRPLDPVKCQQQTRSEGVFLPVNK